MMGLEIAAFLFLTFASEPTQARILAWLALTPESLVRGHVWKLVTTSLLAEGGVAFFFDLLMLWLFIPTLEQWYGPKRFLAFALATTVTGNLASALVGLALAPSFPVLGLSPFIYASIAAYGVLFGSQPVQFFGVIPMKARTLAIGVAVVVALFVLLDRQWVDGAGFFAAMGLAWVLTSGVVTPNLWWLRLRRWRLRRRYQVLDGGQSGLKKKRWMN